MGSLRTMSARRLLLLCGAAVALVFACVAVASAVSSDPAPPPAKPLAVAIHDAAAAPPAQAVTARVEWTNKLVDANGFEGISPLIAGGKGRLWWSSKDSFRLEVQGSSGDAQVVAQNGEVWVWDAASNQAWHTTLPPDKAGSADKAHTKGVPTVAEIQAKLQKAFESVAVAGPTPGVQAHQPAYSVRVTPKDRGGLLGAVGLAWDSARGIPLRVGVYARGASSPVIELRATDIQYGPVDSGVFAVRPPAGTKITEVATGAKDRNGTRSGHRVEPKLSDLGFKPTAPASLASRKRTDIRALGTGDDAAAAVVYGQGLGAIVVIERPAGAPGKAAGGKAGKPQVNLPTTDVNGVQAQVLETPLGSAVQWTRNGITYVVVGSVPRSVVEAAARGL